jgi:hypothetical protein
VWRLDGGHLNVRATASRSAEIVGEIPDGTEVEIGCQTTGDPVSGTDVWDFLPAYGGYVSDYYVYTGHDGFMPGAERCDGDTAPPPEGTTTGEAVKERPDRREKDSSVSAPAGNAAAAIAEARRHVGYSESGVDCNMFSSGLGRPCQGWCADFVNYVWDKAGFDVAGLNGSPDSFLAVGRQRGTFKSGMNAAAAPGDAVIWGNGSPGAPHIGMVTEVLSDGRITVIHGNYEDRVHEGTISRQSDVGTGANIFGFVSPSR